MMKTFTLYFLALFIITVVSLCSCIDLNDSNSPQCDGNCIYGYGTKKYPDGGYEQGNWRYAKLNGRGKQSFGSASKYAGDTYVGNFNNGYDGYGVYYGKRLDFIYKGYWKNGVPNGYGETISGPNSTNPGWSYKGEWKDGKHDGYGTLFMGTVGRHAGIKYVGYWGDDKMEGMGKYYWPDGSVYDGHFANDLFDGNSIFIFSDGYKFTGNWRQGYNSEFKKILVWHTKQSKNGDSVLNKFFAEQ